MKQLLIAGDSFFTSDTLNRPGQHFSEMFGDNVKVTNVSGPGFTNTGIVGQMLYALLERDYDYVVLGFTAPHRFPLAGETKWSLSPMFLQWRSTAHATSRREREIVDTFLGISGYEEQMFNSMMVMYSALTMLKLRVKKTKFAWAVGGMQETFEHFKTIDNADVRKYITTVINEFRPLCLSKDLWAYKPLKDHDPIWHIDDVEYQREIAEEFKTILRIA